MKRLASAIAVAVLAIGGISACGGGGGGGDDAYCGALKAADKNPDLKSLDASSKTSMEKATAIIQGLADKAPSAISADWKVVVDTFNAIRAGNVQGVDQTKFTTAFNNVAKDAKTRCNVDVNQIGQ